MNKRKLILSVAGLAILGGAGYFGLAYSLPILSSQLIRQNGFPGAKVQNFYVTPTGFLIDHIALDSNDFSTMDTITITMNWWDFIKNRKIQSVTVKDIALTAEIDEAGHFKIAGWDATLPQSSDQSAMLPIDSLLLQGVTVDLDTPQGEIRVEGKLSVEKSNATEQTVQYSVWGQQHQLSFDTTGSGKLFANGQIKLDTTLNEGRLNLDNVELSRASGQLTYERIANDKSPIIKGQLIAGKINTMGALLQNVNVSLDTTKPEALYFKTSPAGYKDINLTGRWLTTPDSHVELKIDSTKTMDVIELLLPDKKDDFKTWAKDADPLSLTLVAPVEALQNDVKEASYQIALGNPKSAHQLQADGQVSYDAINEKTLLRLNKTNIATAGGQIDVSPFTLDLGDNTKTVGTILTVKSVDMSKLAKMADVKGLTAKGQLSGTVPLTIAPTGLSIGQGNLKSDGDGTFAYAPAEFPRSLQGDDERMKTVRETLKDFRFSKFVVTMSGSLDDKMKTTLNAEGVNPAFGDRPIHLNLNLDGDLGGVLRQALQTIDFSDKIQEQLNTQKSKKSE